jgi:hypothetical protein
MTAERMRDPLGFILGGHDRRYKETKVHTP